MQLYQYKQFQYIIESAASPKKQQQTPSFKIFAQHYVDHNKIHSWTSALSQFDRHDFICRLVAIVNEFLMNVYIKSYAYWVVIAVGVRRKNGTLWSFIRFWLSLQCIRCIVVISFLEYRTTIPLIIRGHQESVWVCESVDGAFLSIFYYFIFFQIPMWMICIPLPVLFAILQEAHCHRSIDYCSHHYWANDLNSCVLFFSTKIMNNRWFKREIWT